MRYTCRCQDVSCNNKHEDDLTPAQRAALKPGLDTVTSMRRYRRAMWARLGYKPGLTFADLEQPAPPCPCSTPAQLRAADRTAAFRHVMAHPYRSEAGAQESPDRAWVEWENAVAAWNAGNA